MKKLLIALVVALSLTTTYASDYAESYQYNLQPVTVYTGKTVTVKKHYDVYQPKVVYEKVNSYSTVTVCKTCE